MKLKLNTPADMALFMGKYDLRLIYTKKSQPKIINSKIDKKQQQEMVRKFFAIFSNKIHMFSETEKKMLEQKKDCNLITIFL